MPDQDPTVYFNTGELEPQLFSYFLALFFFFFSPERKTTKFLFFFFFTNWWQILSFLFWNKLRQLFFSLPYFQLLNRVWSVPVLTTREPLIVGFLWGTCSVREPLRGGWDPPRAGGPSQGCEPHPRAGSQAQGCARHAWKFKLSELRPWRTIAPAGSSVLGRPLRLPFLRDAPASPQPPSLQTFTSFPDKRAITTWQQQLTKKMGMTLRSSFCGSTLGQSPTKPACSHLIPEEPPRLARLTKNWLGDSFVWRLCDSWASRRKGGGRQKLFKSQVKCKRNTFPTKQTLSCVQLVPECPHKARAAVLVWCRRGSGASPAGPAPSQLRGLEGLECKNSKSSLRPILVCSPRPGPGISPGTSHWWVLWHWYWGFWPDIQVKIPQMTLSSWNETFGLH